MKKLIALVVGIIWFGFVQAQTDTIYIMKSGKVLYQQSTKAEEVDSIIFYHPRTAAPKPGSPIIAGQNDTMYIMKSGNVTYYRSIKEADVDSIVFSLPPPIQPPPFKPLIVQLQGGNFFMGSPVTEVRTDFGTDETQHWVKLSAFQLSNYETTNAEFAAFLNTKNIEDNGLYAAGAYPNEPLAVDCRSDSQCHWGLYYNGGNWVPMQGYENHPVVHVSWFGATEYAAYVGGRLPTEAEWEYACRAGTTTPFHTGICLTDQQANYDWRYPYNNCVPSNTTPLIKPMPAGSFPANGFDLYDMHGNVGEWCSDWYGLYPTALETDPKGPASGPYRVSRGGGHSNVAEACRSAMRHYKPLENGHTRTVGFRVAFDLP